MRFGKLARPALGITTAILLVAGTMPAADRVIWQTDFATAAEESGRSQKPMLVEVTASWCTYCKKMDRTTFADEGVARHVNGCFIPVSIDADVHERLVQTIGVDALPATVILSPELKVVKRITGYQTPHQFQQHLRTICHPEGMPVAHQAPPAAPLDADDAPVSAPRPEPEPDFGGYCLVSMLDERKFRQGDAEYTLEYRGRRLRFVSADHQERFARDPQRYWPVGDGWCAISRSGEMQPRECDAKTAVIFRGRLWMFADRTLQRKFYDNPAAHLTRLSQR
ncbi:MAG: thioredoxin family protein [Planctomycetes bacterium]|nr:thioredoxin family protein [Planctomycetota bacterium]